MEIRKFLAQVASAVEGAEFVSAKDAKAKKVMSTGQDSAWALIDCQPTFTDAHEALAEQALAHVLSYDGDNTFLKALKTVAGFDEIGMTQADLTARIIPVYLRSLTETLPEGFGANSEFVGEIGEEVVFRGAVAQARTVGTKRGPKQVVTLIDKANNVFVYWPSNRVLALEAGQSVRVFGKVKAHNVYNAVKQTLLTWCKIAVIPTV